MATDALRYPIENRAPNIERWQYPRILHVFARAAMARFTTDAHLHEVIGTEIPARRLKRLSQQYLDGAVRVGLVAQEANLFGEGS